MKVRIQKRKKDNKTVYGLILGYKNLEGKHTSKSLSFVSDNLQKTENYRYRINEKLEKGRIENLEDALDIAEDIFNDDCFVLNSKLHSHSTFEEYSKEIVEYKYKIKNISEKTYKSYLTALNHLNEFFGEIRVSDLKTRMINEYIAKKSEEVSSSTLDQHLTVLSLIIKSALRDDVLLKDIMVGIEKPKKSKKETYIYSEEEVSTLVSTLRDYGSNDLNLKIQLILKLGLRNSEVLGLCWDAIDFNNQLIHIKRITSRDVNGKEVLEDRTKTKTSNRILKLSNQLVEELKEYKKYQLSNNEMCESQLLFHKNGKPVASDIFSKEFKRFLEKYNLPITTVHGLRHFYGSLLIKYGCPITEVSRNMGHANPSITTSIYAHELDDPSKKSADFMDNIYENIF